MNVFQCLKRGVWLPFGAFAMLRLKPIQQFKQNADQKQLRSGHFLDLYKRQLFFFLFVTSFCSITAVSMQKKNGDAVTEKLLVFSQQFLIQKSHLQPAMAQGWLRSPKTKQNHSKASFCCRQLKTGNGTFQVILQLMNCLQNSNAILEARGFLASIGICTNRFLKCIINLPASILCFSPALIIQFQVSSVALYVDRCPPTPTAT